MNNRGFTLVELLATIIILAIVIGIGSLSVTAIINNSKQKNFDILVGNIKEGAEVYYQECKYAINSGISCEETTTGGTVYYTISLGDLVKYGYIKGNSTGADNKYTITNPNKNDDNIACCTIKISYNNKINIVQTTPTGPCLTSSSCPTNADYQKTYGRN